VSKIEQWRDDIERKPPCTGSTWDELQKELYGTHEVQSVTGDLETQVGTHDVQTVSGDLGVNSTEPGSGNHLSPDFPGEPIDYGDNDDDDGPSYEWLMWDWFSFCQFSSALPERIELLPADPRGQPLKNFPYLWNPVGTFVSPGLGALLPRDYNFIGINKGLRLSDNDVKSFGSYFDYLPRWKIGTDIALPCSIYNGWYKLSGSDECFRMPRGSDSSIREADVKICSLYGAGFYYIPGTDTCVKIGGYARSSSEFYNPGLDAPQANNSRLYYWSEPLPQTPAIQRTAAILREYARFDPREKYCFLQLKGSDTGGRIPGSDQCVTLQPSGTAIVADIPGDVLRQAVEKAKTSQAKPEGGPTAQPGQWVDSQTGKVADVGPEGTLPNLLDSNRALNLHTGKSYTKGKDGVWKDNAGNPVKTWPLNTQVSPDTPNVATHPGTGKVYVLGGTQGAATNQGQAKQQPAPSDPIKDKLDAALKKQQDFRGELSKFEGERDRLFTEIKAAGGNPQDNTDYLDKVVRVHFVEWKLRNVTDRIDFLKAGKDPDSAAVKPILDKLNLARNEKDGLDAQLPKLMAEEKRRENAFKEVSKTYPDPGTNLDKISDALRQPWLDWNAARENRQKAQIRLGQLTDRIDALQQGKDPDPKPSLWDELRFDADNGLIFDQPNGSVEPPKLGWGTGTKQGEKKEEDKKPAGDSSWGTGTIQSIDDAAKALHEAFKGELPPEKEHKEKECPKDATDGASINVFGKVTLASSEGGGIPQGALKLVPKLSWSLPGEVKKSAYENIGADQGPIFGAWNTDTGSFKWTIPCDQKGWYGFLNAKPGSNWSLSLNLPSSSAYVVQVNRKEAKPDLTGYFPKGLQAAADGFDVADLHFMRISARFDDWYEAVLFMAAFVGVSPEVVAADWCWQKLPAVDMQPATSTAAGHEYPEANLQLDGPKTKELGVQ
jgi:Porin subfamily